MDAVAVRGKERGEMTKEEAHEVLCAANLKVHELTIARDKKQDAFLRYERTRIAMAIEIEFGASLRAALEARRIARDAHDSAIEADALSGKGSKYPVGTQMEEWGTRSMGYRRTPPPAVRTGVRGIIEAITRESVHPANSAAYSRAHVGSFVIRLLKKNGTPSQRYVKPYSNGDFHGWKVEAK